MHLLPPKYRQALANRPFRLFALGYGVSSLGDGMSALAVAWLAIEISSPRDRGLAVGAAVAAYTLPGAVGFLLQRILGRFDARRLLKLDCGLRGAGLGTIALLGYLGQLRIGTYVALLAVSALLASWGTAARYTLVAETLPEPVRLSGNALLGTALNVAFVAGPAMAGIITAAASAAAVLAVDALSWLLFAACLMLAHAPTAATAAGPRTAGGDTRSGWRIISASPTLLGLLVLTLPFFFFYGPVEVALPIFVKQNLHQTAAVLGAFWTCFGAGALTGSFAFGVIRRPPLFPLALAIILGWGAALSVIPFSGAPAGIAAFALGGFIWAPYPVLLTTVLQQQASGRDLTALSAAWTSTTMLATPLGTAAGGPLVTAVGAPRTLLISALATVAIVPVAAVIRRR